MSLGKWFLGATLLVCSGSLLIAAEAPVASTQPAEKPMRLRKLTKPWSMLKSLSPDQTTQIEKIHADALEQTKKIDAKEEDDIKALLNPEQLTELKDVTKSEHKEMMSKRKKDMATTEPSR